VVSREELGTVAGGHGFAGFVQALAARGTPVVVTSFGTPYLLSSFPEVPAYLLAWSRIEICQRAAADALLGRAAITGRTPVTLSPGAGIASGLDRDVGAP
jgi:beta-N-acetylhexosaminidase